MLKTSWSYIPGALHENRTLMTLIELINADKNSVDLLNLCYLHAIRERHDRTLMTLIELINADKNSADLLNLCHLRAVK